MKVVLSAGGRFHAFHLAYQLVKRKALKHFYTASYEKNDRLKVPTEFVVNNYALQYAEWIYEKTRLNRLFHTSDYYVVRDNYFDRWVAPQLYESIDIFTVWAHFALASIPRAKECGARVVLECGSMHILEQEQILVEEYEHFGMIYPPLNPRNRDKMLREYQETDYIAIPALHVEKSFIKHGISGNKLIKTPYGTNLDLFKPKKIKPHGKFTALFVGAININKGIPYLLDAWKKLDLPIDEAQLLLVGNVYKDIRATYLKKYRTPENVIFVGGVPQSSLACFYEQADIFVFPSLQEGVAMVQVEAMASGTPVVSTVNAGAQELFVNGIEGFILPIRNSDALAEKILWGYQHREELFEMGQRAAQRAQSYSWDAYGERVIDAYQKILAE